MNSVDKANIVDKAICCSGTMGKTVADMFLSGHKCAEKEFQKLLLLVNYTEALGCYRAPVEVTEYTVIEGEAAVAEFQIVIPCTTYNTVIAGSDSVTVTVDGNDSSAFGDDILTIGEILTTLMGGTGFDVQYVSATDCSSGNMTINVVGDCDTESISVTITLVSGHAAQTVTYPGTVTQVGNCSGDSLESSLITTEYTNCLTEDEADDIATQISRLCDLCEDN